MAVVPPVKPLSSTTFKLLIHWGAADLFETRWYSVLVRRVANKRCYICEPIRTGRGRNGPINLNKGLKAIFSSFQARSVNHSDRLIILGASDSKEPLASFRPTSGKSFLCPFHSLCLLCDYLYRCPGYHSGYLQYVLHFIVSYFFFVVRLRGRLRYFFLWITKYIKWTFHFNFSSNMVKVYHFTLEKR